MHKALLLLLLAVVAVAIFDQRTDIVGGDVEPAALAGVPAGFRSLAQCSGSAPCISGPVGRYAFMCMNDVGGQALPGGHIDAITTAPTLSFVSPHGSICIVEPMSQ